jgi:hypothetical protein
MAVFAIVFSELVLLALALFGGIICYTELQRLKFEQSADDAVFAASLAADDETDTPPESKRAEKQRAKAQDEQAEIDRILEKISASGMDSLSRKERKTLDRASAKSRHPRADTRAGPVSDRTPADSTQTARSAASAASMSPSVLNGPSDSRVAPPVSRVPNAACARGAQWIPARLRIPNSASRIVANSAAP